MILLILVAFLFPLSLYCLILALLNRRAHPVMVSGPWDFAGVLFAVSGFLVFGGPYILNTFYHRWLDHWLTHSAYRDKPLEDKYLYWISLWAAYFVLVVGLSALVLWLRRWQTSIYNVDPADCEEVLAHALDRLGLTWYRAGNRFVANGGTTASGSPPLRSVGEATEDMLVIQVDAFPMLRHVSLRWSNADSLVRQKIERELDPMFKQIHTSDNPAGVWLLSFATGLFALMTFDIILFVYRLWLELR